MCVSGQFKGTQLRWPTVEKESFARVSWCRRGEWVLHQVVRTFKAVRFECEDSPVGGTGAIRSGGIMSAQCCPSWEKYKTVPLQGGSWPRATTPFATPAAHQGVSPERRARQRSKGTAPICGGEGAYQSREDMGIGEQGHAADCRGGGVRDGVTSQQATLAEQYCEHVDGTLAGHIRS